ncbi:MAG: site-specific integrase [Pseudomonadota bacterium]|nr:site-specific integrase [Pseudomonadota bacterium]
MRVKLTQNLVSAVHADERDNVFSDVALSGFELRVRPTGVKIWYYRFRCNSGRQQRLALGRFPGLSAVTARQLATAAAGDVARGIDPVAHRRQVRAEHARERQRTLRALIESHYEGWASTHLKSWRFQLGRIKADFKAWMDKPINEIDRNLIEGWRQRRRAAGNQPVTVNRGVQRLHALLAKAVEWKVIDKHPFSGLKPLRHDRSGHVRYLNETEETALRDALQARDNKLREERNRFNKWLEDRGRRTFPPRTNRFVDHLTPIVLVAMNTGLRRGEIFQLEWKDIDLVDRLVTVTGAKAKSGQTRRLPLNQEAYEVLTSWHAQADKRGGSHVFPGVNGLRLTTINTAWRSLQAAAGLPDFRFHDLRHHFASRLVQSGIDLNTVRELLGHADITMVLRYAHMSPDRLSMAVEQVARRASKLRDVTSLRSSQKIDELTLATVSYRHAGRQ